MILNPFKCEKCQEPLQPNDIGIKVESDDLIRVCGFCGNEVKV